MTGDRDLPAPGPGPLPPRKGQMPPPYRPPAPPAPPAPPPRTVHPLDLAAAAPHAPEPEVVPPSTNQQQRSPVPLVLPGPGRGRDSSKRLTVIAGSVCVGLAIIVVALVATRDRGEEVADDRPTTTPAPTAATTTTEPAEQVPSTEAASTGTTMVVPATVGTDVGLLPAGLFCRDLRQMGLTFVAAVDYWRREGQTDRMDIDLNGVPCETVYPVEEVRSIFPSATIAPRSSAPSLPSGLICRDLRDRGADVYAALDYYVSEGFPERMDADGDGVPCETVYSDAEAVWSRDF